MESFFKVLSYVIYIYIFICEKSTENNNYFLKNSFILDTFMKKNYMLLHLSSTLKNKYFIEKKLVQRLAKKLS